MAVVEEVQSVNEHVACGDILCTGGATLVFEVELLKIERKEEL